MFPRAIQWLGLIHLKAIGTRLALALVFAVTAQTNLGQTSTTTGADRTTLVLGTPVERELPTNEKHSYQVELQPDKYAKIVLKQAGIDVVIRFFGPNDKALAEFDSEMRPNGDEVVELVANTSGTYRFDVEPRYKLLPAGRYEIRLTEIRTATESDKSLQDARNQLTESIRRFIAGKYAEAQVLAEHAIEIRQKELGAEDAATATALTQLARTLDSQGKFQEALQLNNRILQIREKVLGPDHPDFAYTLNYLATNSNHLEDYKSALSYHERALAVREKAFGPVHPIVAVSLINLGVVCDALGDKLKAGQLYERALKIQEQTVGPENLNVAIILNNIGKIYNDLGDPKKAEPYSLRAVALLEKLFPPDNPRIFDALTNLAECYAGLGDLDKAETIYQRILAFREKNVGPDHPLTAHALFNVANVYELKADFAKAESLYRRALDIREKTLGQENPGVGEIVSSLALLYAETGQIDKAIQTQKRAREIDERNIGIYLTIGSERQKIAYINSLSDRLNQNLFIQTRFAPSDPAAVELATTTVLQQKGRVLDALSNSLIGLRQRFDDHDRALLDNLNETTTKLAGLILSGPEDRTVAEHQLLIKDLSDKREALEDEISRLAAGAFTKSAPVSLTSVQAAIPEDSALIEFAICQPEQLSPAKSADKALSEPHYVAYVLRREGKVLWQDIGSVKELDAKIGEFRQALRDPQRKDLKQVARNVDERLMRPLRELIGNSIHLLVSPDGELNLIPFEALVDEQNRYLVERYSFSYLTSGRDLLRMNVPRESKSAPLLIANPSFGTPEAKQTAGANVKDQSLTRSRKSVNGPRRSIINVRDLSDAYFAPLSGTVAEARSIQSLFPDARLLTGAEASETALKQAVAPSILHIATHGFFIEDQTEGQGDANAAKRSGQYSPSIENPLLRSGIALAGANRRIGSDDGILTALEASGLNLWGTKLVVLSACDTGVGEVRNGEGVYGLRRAFVQAGAESLVMSLWPVSDAVTRELMTNYYKNLKQGLGRGDSLRHVQLEMLKRPSRQHPFYWAGFIQSGDWRTIR